MAPGVGARSVAGGVSPTRGSGRYGAAVALLRVTSGALGLLAPRTIQRLSLLPADTPAPARIWTRFWATRAIGLGVGYLLADTHTRRHLIRMGLLVDGLDTAFLMAMLAPDDGHRRSLIWLASLTGTAAMLDIGEIRRGAS